MEADADYKNALPGEVVEETPSDTPRQLRTIADREPALSRREAEAAGLTVTPDVVYGESDEDPNRDDQFDEHHGSEATAP